MLTLEISLKDKTIPVSIDSSGGLSVIVMCAEGIADLTIIASDSVRHVKWHEGPLADEEEIRIKIIDYEGL